MLLKNLTILCYVRRVKPTNLRPQFENRFLIIQNQKLRKMEKRFTL